MIRLVPEASGLEGEILTLSIVLGVRIGGLVIMYHLHNLQQIILVQFLQTIGKLVHINLYNDLASNKDLQQIRSLTFFSVRFFFLALSSPVAPRLDLRPFSSPGTGPDSRNKARRAGLGLRKVCNKHQMSVNFDFILRIHQRRSHNRVLGLITSLSKVQVMPDRVCLIRNQLNGHIKLTPSLLLDAEGGLLESWFRVSSAMICPKKGQCLSDDRTAAAAYSIKR